MLTPHVTELPLNMAAVTPDPFAEPARMRGREEERRRRERRVRLVRDELRARNGRRAASTEAA
jgi:hypothetical protein